MWENSFFLQRSFHRGRPSIEAAACVGALPEAVGPDMEIHVRSVLGSMFELGLTPTGHFSEVDSFQVFAKAS